MRSISILIIFTLSIALLLSCAGTKPQSNSEPKDENSISKDYNSVKDSIDFDTAPILVKRVTPEYPTEAKDQNITADVYVKALVDKFGIVEKVIIVNENEKNVTLFIESVKNAAYAYEMKPATKDGKPIDAWITYKVEFSIK